jgi:hypothetical protein
MSNPNRITDEFGWQQEILEPSPYDAAPFHQGDTITQVRRNTTDDQQWQPSEVLIGPVRGQSHNSPWFGNTSPNLVPQFSQSDEATGPVSGGTNGVITWRQWLTATEVPASSIASEVFASVYEFPYAFRG